MLFNSYSFAFFFPTVCLIYFVIPIKIRHLWLLITSYYFYMSWRPEYALLLLLSTTVTFLSGKAIAYFHRKPVKDETQIKRIKQQKKTILILCILINMALLIFFKYFNFLLDNLNGLIAFFNGHPIKNPFDIVLPIGISFYIFQALSYSIDVYRGDISDEPNFLKYALFVSFFPPLVAGPIERSSNLLTQIDKICSLSRWDSRRIIDGLQTMLYGFFLKMVVSDRLSPFVEEIFHNPTVYGRFALIVGCTFFSVQIYCDFNGYSLIAIGCAKILGFSLMENFRAPYLSRSIQEFWRNWHISLSTWFRDYMYIPLGGSRVSPPRRYANLFLVFLASGFWHGANWTFVVWGILNWAYQVLGVITESFRHKAYLTLGINEKKNPYAIFLQVLITFSLVTFAWIFFRSDNISIAAQYIHGIIMGNGQPSFSLNKLLSTDSKKVEFIIALCGISIVFVADYIKKIYQLSLNAALEKRHPLFRWSVYFFFIMAIYIFGIYGDAFQSVDFIYFQF